MENTITLLGYYGGDEAHACSAWTSTGQQFLDEIEVKTGEPRRARIPGMLASLARDGHHTPFEKSSLHFLVTAEIASHIHCLKHRIGVSINGESARYKELKEDRFYVPTDWPENEQMYLMDHCEQGFSRYHNTLERLVARGMDRKRAKESARFYLPYAAQVQFDVMFNFRSFYHFLGLRKKPNAQMEIREIAAEMLRLVQGIEGNPFKHTLNAFGYGKEEA
jgi:thymidylate synthase (FAD)